MAPLKSARAAMMAPVEPEEDEAAEGEAAEGEGEAAEGEGEAAKEE